MNVPGLPPIPPSSTVPARAARHRRGFGFATLALVPAVTWLLLFYFWISLLWFGETYEGWDYNLFQYALERFFLPVSLVLAAATWRSSGFLGSDAPWLRTRQAAVACALPGAIPAIT